MMKTRSGILLGSRFLFVKKKHLLENQQVFLFTSYTGYYSTSVTNSAAVISNSARIVITSSSVVAA